MKINNELISDYFKCKYKVFLKLNKNIGVKSEFELANNKLNTLYKARAMFEVYGKAVDLKDKTYIKSLHDFDKVLFGGYHENDDYSVSIDAIEKNIDDNKKLELVPVSICKNNKIDSIQKLVTAFQVMSLSSIQDISTTYGKIIYGDSCKIQKIKLDKYITKLQETIRDILRIRNNEVIPELFLNKHCEICEFKDKCHLEAVNKDDLSLIKGLSFKEIENLKSKGIFTVTQYSYSFRPKKRMRVVENNKHYNSLKALAIREKKIYIVNKISLPSSAIKIFLDVEGVPDKDFYYLIGIVVVDEEKEGRYSFWAKDKTEEKLIWNQFLNVLHRLQGKTYTIYHYGSYETVFIKNMLKRYGCNDVDLLDKIGGSLFNVLSYIYSNVYFPTYSNGLKDLSRYLGFKWSNENLTGVLSIVWRESWQIVNDSIIKDALIEYNIEDCFALKNLVDALNSISQDSSDAVYSKEIKPENTYKFQKNNYAFSELDYINKCSYFEYQNRNVYVRTNKNLKRIRNANKKSCENKNKIKINQNMQLQLEGKCPRCGSNSLYKHQKYNRIVYDIIFKDYGVKRWIINYQYYRYKCKECKIAFVPEENKFIDKYGHNLLAWVVYNHVELGQSFDNAVKLLNGLFGFNMNRGVVAEFKRKASQYYENAFSKLKDKIKCGSLIHADETRIKLQDGIGYVWVFTNMEEVIYIFNDTREGSILDDILDGFNGVLVSDFYTAYDSKDCPQQKCLIHLIRDLNDDLFKNPLDQELKKLGYRFTVLLNNIVETIDKYGLKKKELVKHKKKVQEFFDYISEENYNFGITNKYKKRFIKYKNKLFTFLDYDNVPWNNNNAERAIKGFAKYRKVANGILTKEGLERYLILLSISTTCKYKNIDFFQYLLSRKGDIDEFVDSLLK